MRTSIINICAYRLLYQYMIGLKDDISKLNICHKHTISFHHHHLCENMLWVGNGTNKYKLLCYIFFIYLILIFLPYNIDVTRQTLLFPSFDIQIKQSTDLIMLELQFHKYQQCHSPFVCRNLVSYICDQFAHV